MLYNTPLTKWIIKYKVNPYVLVESNRTKASLAKLICQKPTFQVQLMRY
jgi:hypothetical protein